MAIITSQALIKRANFLREDLTPAFVVAVLRFMREYLEDM